MTAERCDETVVCRLTSPLLYVIVITSDCRASCFAARLLLGWSICCRVNLSDRDALRRDATRRNAIRPPARSGHAGRETYINRVRRLYNNSHVEYGTWIWNRVRSRSRDGFTFRAVYRPIVRLGCDDGRIVGSSYTCLLSSFAVEVENFWRHEITAPEKPARRSVSTFALRKWHRAVV